MPPKGYVHRAKQIGFLTAEKHRRLREPQIPEWIELATEAFKDSSPHSPERANLREWRRWSDRARKVPVELAEEIARTTSEAGSIWENAKKQNDWKSFEPYLRKIFGLKSEEAGALGYESEAYNALLDEFEPGFTTSDFDDITRNLIPALKELLDSIMGRIAKVDSSCLYRHFPVPLQEKFGRIVIRKLGYDFDAGRIDVTVHPFTTSPGPEDVRITTRYDEHDFSLAFFSTVHEAGHALYDQGLEKEHWGTPAGMPVSLGIHESQSRFWENVVARSSAFWRFWYPSLLQHFPILTDVSLETFWKALNRVQPSLIRIQADELTYVFHIILRYEIERDLMRGQLAVEDIPDCWNEKMTQYLGCSPSSFTEGALQDVHWSAGLIGYFPTYLLGNIYAAQFLEKMQRDLGGNIEEFLSSGLFGIILGWLRENVHVKGSLFSPKDLVREITGSEPNPEHFVRYLRARFRAVYDL
jgi:carboxypeptidase Taq